MVVYLVVHDGVCHSWTPHLSLLDGLKDEQVTQKASLHPPKTTSEIRLSREKEKISVSVCIEERERPLKGSGRGRCERHKQIESTLTTKSQPKDDA